MTDTTTTATAVAQPIADANSIDGIIDNAVTETPKDDVAEPVTEPTAEPVKDEPWPKKAENALAREKGKTAKLKFERDQERAARQDLEQKLSQFNAPKTTVDTSVKATGIPTKLDPNKFANWADYSEARAEEIADYKFEQKFTERDSKQKQTQQTQQDQAWIAERETHVAKQAQDFIKENPEAQALVEEHGDLIDELPPQIQRLFLEADNAPLAFFNLAKEGKLEALGSMSTAKAAMEIGRAQTQAASKPQTKAPAPLPASRGSVASGKSLDSMSGNELLAWIES